MLVQNLLSAPILFFLAGCIARVVRSDLEIPAPLPKLFSIFLLTAIGLKGGVELHAAGFSTKLLLTLGTATLMAFATPLWVYAFFRRKLDACNAAALAATYGSVSAVTFITAGGFLQSIGVPYNGHLVAALALMESPAIIVGVFLARRSESMGRATRHSEFGSLLREACLNGSVFLLLAALAIGTVLGKERTSDIQPFFGGLFKGILCLFLLDMGMVAARRMQDLFHGGLFMLAASVLVPLFNAAVAIGLASLLGMPPGDALMFTVLCASASYIAVPAALSVSLPGANPSIYLSMSLALTFPFNVLFGIPLYMEMIQIFLK
jgi:hypothetical protein